MTSLDTLKTLLTEGDLISAADAAEQLAQTQTALDQRWFVTIYDKLWQPTGMLGDDLIEASGTDPRNNLPTLTLKVKGSSEHIEKFMQCQDTMVGVTVETQGLRWAYYVDTFDYEFQDGGWYGTANCNGIWDILNYLQIWPN